MATSILVKNSEGKFDFLQHSKTVSVTIAADETKTKVIDVSGFKDLAIMMPAEWTTATLSLEGSDVVDGTFVDVYDIEGNKVSIAAAASRIIPTLNIIAPLQYIKLVSSATQSAARDLKIFLSN